MGNPQPDTRVRRCSRVRLVVVSASSGAGCAGATAVVAGCTGVRAAECAGTERAAIVREAQPGGGTKLCSGGEYSSIIDPVEHKRDDDQIEGLRPPPAYFAIPI